MMTDARAAWRRLAQAEPAGTILVYTGLLLVVVCSAGLLVAYSRTSPRGHALLALGAFAAWTALMAGGWARGDLPLRPVLAAIAVVMLCAVATPSYLSRDPYSYAAYGRVATAHHANPYFHAPDEFPNDPVVAKVSSTWQSTPDIYGPAFTAVMVAFAPIVGTSDFGVHFAYQLLALGAVVLVLVLLWRRTRRALVLAFAALHPIAAISVVNGGHPDALLALGLLAGVLLALENRSILSAVALGLTAAINPTLLAAAVVLAVWAYPRWARVAFWKFVAFVVLIGAVPYLALPGWLSTAHAHSQLISRQSIWHVVGAFFAKSDPSSIGLFTGGDMRHLASTGAMLGAGLLVLLVLVRNRRSAAPEFAVAAAVASFFIAGAWVMPWYAFAAIPLLALVRPSLLTFVIAAYAALILVGDQFPRLTAGQAGGFVHQSLQLWVPIIAFVLGVVAVARRPRAKVAEAAISLPGDVTDEPALATSA